MEPATTSSHKAPQRPANAQQRSSLCGHSTGTCDDLGAHTERCIACRDWYIRDVGLPPLPTHLWPWVPGSKTVPSASKRFLLVFVTSAVVQTFDVFRGPVMLPRSALQDHLPTTNCRWLVANGRFLSTTQETPPPPLDPPTAPPTPLKRNSGIRSFGELPAVCHHHQLLHAIGQRPANKLPGAVWNARGFGHLVSRCLWGRRPGKPLQCWVTLPSSTLGGVAHVTLYCMAEGMTCNRQHCFDCSLGAGLRRRGWEANGRLMWW